MWLTIWDDAAEADDFARAADQVAGPVTVARRAEAVALFLGPRELATAALASTLDAWRVSVDPGYPEERCSPTTRSSARLSTP